MRNLIICVDFDGVLHSYCSGWQGVDIISDPPVPGAIEWLRGLLPRPGYKGPIAVIYSARSGWPAGVTAMRQWLRLHGLTKGELNSLEFPTEKPAAFLTIDDRAICFDGKFPTESEMLEFKPWYKKEIGSLSKDVTTAIGWAYAYACDLVDRNVDIRKSTVLSMVACYESDMANSKKVGG